MFRPFVCGGVSALGHLVDTYEYTLGTQKPQTNTLRIEIRKCVAELDRSVLFLMITLRSRIIKFILNDDAICHCLYIFLTPDGESHWMLKPGGTGSRSW